MRLAALRVRQEREVAGALYGPRKLALLLGVKSGLPAGEDFSRGSDEIADPVDVLVIEHDVLAGLEYVSYYSAAAAAWVKPATGIRGPGSSLI